MDFSETPYYAPNYDNPLSLPDGRQPPLLRAAHTRSRLFEYHVINLYHYEIVGYVSETRVAGGPPEVEGDWRNLLRLRGLLS